jgi:segregation and condensation protein B
MSKRKSKNPTPFELAETGESPAVELPSNDHDDPRLPSDVEATVNLTGDFPLPGRDDLEAPTQTELPASSPESLFGATRKHLRGLLEALVFASDHPIKPNELAKAASAQLKEVKALLEELKENYAGRGVQLDEVAGGWIFRTSPAYAPFVRDLTKQKPVKLTRAQIETLAILAYRQPITRPEIDEIRGVDSGPVLKLLLERDLVRILGKKDEPGRPLLYGTTGEFLEFFGLKSVKDLPTLREFTELNEDSRRVVERELGETLESVQEAQLEANKIVEETSEVVGPHDTIAPPAAPDTDAPPDTKEAEEEEELAEGDRDEDFDDDDDDDDEDG